MIRITGWFAAAAIAAAMMLPAVPAQAAQRATGIEKAAPMEVGSVHRRWHRRAYSHYRPYPYRYDRPYYSYYRPYPFYRAPVPFGWYW